MHLRHTDADEAGPFAHHDVAGQSVLSDTPLPSLAPFACPAPGAVSPIARPSLRQTGQEREVYSDLAWVAGEERHVDCWSGPCGYWLDIHSVGRFWIASDGSAVVLLGDRPGLGRGSGARAQGDSWITEQTVVGPLLVLALSLHGVFCLHASAIASGARAAVLMGRSGCGKSVLAAHLGREPETGWRRAADDIVPVTMGPAGVAVLPRFPQLKLPPSEQPSIGVPGRLNLRVAYVVAPAPVDGAALAKSPKPEPAPGRGGSSARLSHADHVMLRPRLDDLGRREGLQSLVRHTVAARLFDTRLAAAHLAFCAAVATAAPMRRLFYPHSPTALGGVTRLLHADPRGL